MSKTNNTINNYLNLLVNKIKKMEQEKGKNPEPFFIFRGQSEKCSFVQPANMRSAKRLPENQGKDDIIDQINQKDIDFLKDHDRLLINNAKMKGHSVLNGNRKLKDLEILADLRHYGHPTSLMDFTSNFLIALWFACGGYDEHFSQKSNHLKSKGDSKDKEKKDGEVIILDAGNVTQFLQVDSEQIEHELEYFFDEIFKSKKRLFGLSKDSAFNLDLQLWYWIPENLNDRVRDQDCVFVFGVPFIRKNLYTTVTVEHGDKEKLKEELGKYFDYTTDSLFGDKHICTSYYPKKEDNIEQARYYYKLSMDFLSTQKGDIAIRNLKKAVEFFNEEKNSLTEEDRWRLAESYCHLFISLESDRNKVRTDLIKRIDAFNKTDSKSEQQEFVQKAITSRIKKIDSIIKNQIEYINSGLAVVPDHKKLQALKKELPIGRSSE